MKLQIVHSEFLRSLVWPFKRSWYTLWRWIEILLYREREYTVAVPSGHLQYTPWYGRQDSEFEQVIRLVRESGPVTVSLDRCYMLYQFCRYALSIPGAVAECGTYTGGTAHFLAMTIKRHTANDRVPVGLHLFDTFTGMPEAADLKRDHFSPGDFSGTSLAYVQDRLGDFDFVRFHPGLIPGTFSEVAAVSPFSFVHVDVVIYPAVLECCRWFWPRLSPGGVIVFDDYGFRAYRHATRVAVDDYFSDRRYKPIVLPTGQAVAVKPQRMADG